jgi:hypothetical protein
MIIIMLTYMYMYKVTTLKVDLKTQHVLNNLSIITSTLPRTMMLEWLVDVISSPFGTRPIASCPYIFIAHFPLNNIDEKSEGYL